LENNAVKTLLGTLILVIMLSVSIPVMAEIKPYQSIDNAGLNKQERIEVIDKYLVDLAASLKNMESKLDDNAKKLKSLENVVKVIKEAQDKKVEEKLGEKKTTPPGASKDLNEMEKLKADILSLKNQDIEKIKVDFQELKDTVSALQATVRSTQQK
jgi:prefoldin subunit 5